MIPRSSQHRHTVIHAFTLVELLVVVAVIALLLGVLLPALSRARHAAQTSGCLSNLRTLEMAQLAYANDHDGQLVAPGFADDADEGLDPAHSWLRDLQDGFDAPLTVRSPLDASPYWSTEQSGNGQTVPNSVPPRHRLTSYGLNKWVTPLEPGESEHPPFDKLRRIKNPSGTIQWIMIVFEGPLAGVDHADCDDWWDEGDPDAAPRNAADHLQTNAVGGRLATREARANYAFLDGHAATMEFGDVYQGPTRNMFDPRVAH